MAEIVNCPQCQRQLRVPDELLGKRVRCPSCNTMFTAAAGAPVAPAEPVAGEPAAVPSPVPVDDSYAPEPAEYEEAYEGGERRRPGARQRALDRLKAPGICLLITGALGVLVGLIGVVFLLLAINNPRPQPIVPPAGQQGPQMREFFEAMARFQANGPLRFGLQALFLLISALVAAAGICMLMGRAYPLAVAGSVLAMINLGTCCCLLGLPFGIWSLVVLMDKDAKAAFR